MRLTPLQWGLRAPNNPAARGERLRRPPRLGSQSSKEQTDPKHKTSDTSEPLRFHSPLIKPDVRISRIRLPDQGDFMRSPTGSWV